MTGHAGYVGSVMAPILKNAGHEVHGLDTCYFDGCDFGPPPVVLPSVRRDLRDVVVDDFRGFDAVVHLAALSNDPLGNLDSDNTYAINHRASARLAGLAKAAGVERFVFASSCSLYGVAGNEMLDEQAPFNPITAYGESKVMLEQDLAKLADDSFSPTYMRNATAYGVSPRLRLDIVVNNLMGYAVATGKVLIQSDGTPWRPLVHVEDFSLAFLAVLEAPRELVHDTAFNVGQSKENYRVRQVAELVEAAVPGSVVEYAEGGGPDPRDYRVDCSKLATTLPSFQPRWTLERGIAQLRDAYVREGLNADRIQGEHYLRIKRIQALRRDGRLDAELRWREPAMTETPS
jgi:nucleoside-diphosphate-sugar epimerase